MLLSFFFFSFSVFNNSKMFVLLGAKTLHWQKKKGQYKVLTLSTFNLLNYNYF